MQFWVLNESNIKRNAAMKAELMQTLNLHELEAKQNMDRKPHHEKSRDSEDVDGLCFLPLTHVTPCNMDVMHDTADDSINQYL